MRICFVSHSAYMGGAERALLEAIRAFIKRGVTCTVLLPYKGPLCDELEKINIKYKIIRYKPWVSSENISWLKRTRDLLISLIMVIPGLIAVIRWQSTIVYTNTIYIYAGALLAFLSGRAHVWHIHEFGFRDHRFKFLYGKKLSLWFMDRLSIHLIANSKAVREVYAESISPSKIRVVYQSVTVPSPIPCEEKKEGFWCIIVGKIFEGKRQEDAVRAVGDLIKKGLEIGLYILGDGDQGYQSDLARIAQKEGIERKVIFLGYQNDAYRYICLSDVLLMCSRSEAFGRVTIEGMLAGKPVVGARSGATTELIKDGATGLLYTVGNHEDLARKIEQLYWNRLQARLMGEKAQEWALKNFTEERYGDDLIGLLSNIGK